MSPGTGSVVGLFDQIAPVYDRLNRIISWGRDQGWRRELAQCMDLRPGQMILDISAGTGDMETALKGVCPQLEVIGLDPSRRMLDLYRAKIPPATITMGTAESIPARNNSVARAVCAFGLRNFQDRSAAFGEIHRVLEPAGLWGFLEMSAPRGAVFPLFYSLYFKRVAPLIGAVFSRNPVAYRYLRDSVYQFPDHNVIIAEHQQAGLSPVFHRFILRGAVILYIFQKKSQNSSREGSSGS